MQTLRRLRPSLRALGLLLLLALGSYLLNRFPVGLGFGIYYLFGSIFAMLGALWRGPWWGLALGLLAGLPTISLYGHGVMFLVMGLEAGFLGWRAHRKSEGPVRDDLFFWVMVSPLLLAFYLFSVEAPLQALVPTLKQVVNGLFNTSVAALVMLWVKARRPREGERVPLGAILIQMITPLLLLPILISTIVTAAEVNRALQSTTQVELINSRAMVSRSVDEWIAERRAALQSLATLIAPYQQEPPLAATLLEAAAPADPGFLGLYLADHDANVIAQALRQPFPVATGENYAHRPYYQEMMRTGHGVVSDLFWGLGGEAPVVAIAEPVRAASGEMQGYIVGALTLDEGSRLLELIEHGLGMSAVVVDEQGSVLLSSDSAYHPADRFTIPPVGAGRVIADGVHLVVSPLRNNLHVQETATLISESDLAEVPWKLYIFRPLGDLRTTAMRTHAQNMIGGLVAFLILLGVIRISVSWVTRPLELLAEVRITPDGRVSRLPALGPIKVREVHRMQSHLMEVAQHLIAANDRLHHQAEHDALTGLRNARSFWRDLEKQVADEIPCVVMMLDMNGFKRYNDLHGHLVGDLLLKRLGQRGAEVVKEYDGRLYRYGGDEFSAILPPLAARTEQQLAQTLLQEICAEQDGPLRPGFSIGFATFPVDGTTPGELVARADQALYGEKLKDRGGVRWCQQVVRLLAKEGAEERLARLEAVLNFLHQKLPVLFGHSGRVARLAIRVGAELGLSQTELDQLELGALLHDIGKVEVSREIVTKPGPLSLLEFAEVQRHAHCGAALLQELVGDEAVAAVARSHHERYDGTGYPEGLAGEAIPLLARIVAAADAFDAILQKQAYAPNALDEAVAEIAALAGSQFDPQVVEALIKSLQMEPLTLVEHRSPGGQPDGDR